ncbi:MAG: peptidase C56 [Cyanobacteria bacterium QS_7_48_42]|jgi:protease I|nr:MAG: peptidase C56 [Cyanobacteria bacterium QH_7_48_89]PSO81170.1 MAG: peptidase C56 [Cyanobacteria bacterium QS_4_48_99]PSO83555.1 MAG: peptidase C56 [Cyanobacteria bacterium QS_5_48_63]PSO87662.1 MAG: peptidase C56 [Cyanobacteria bacterium QH_9_48_43]PSO88325.1 MAG: peptidase C56 [Cyanobacteria bacterium QS_3_48_167]PSO91146.1 MAG: peptidase C56 [Cyanobacteria bacterium QS_6_48_18]PSO92617.1 MAG: peptidase C56 [Cyanobacteria bacterium SW_6_48_11]PSO95425.1 MAG: peptidase C56 [Cyanobacte
MKRAVIVASNGVEDSEFFYPYYRLQEAGFTVDVATKGKVNVKGKHGVPATATVDAEQIKEPDYDLVVIPGGHESPDRVRQIENVLQFLRDFDQKGKLIASTCHGPWVLVSAGIVKGRQATCYPGCKDDLINAGANYQNASVIVDRNLVTAPHYKQNAVWMKETLAQYEKLSQFQPAAAAVS